MLKLTRVLIVATLMAALISEWQPCLAGQQVDPSLLGKWKLAKLNGIPPPGGLIIEFRADGRVATVEKASEVIGTYFTAKKKSLKQITLKVSLEDNESGQMKDEVITGRYKVVRGRLVLEFFDAPTPFFLFTIGGHTRMEFERLPSSR